MQPRANRFWGAFSPLSFPSSRESRRTAAHNLFAMDSLALLLVAVVGLATGYMPSKQEAMLTDALLREMTAGLLDPNYLDLTENTGPVLASRNLKDLDAFDYELGDDMSPLSPHPSTRDGEYLQHSPSLWGHQYLSGGAGEGKQHLRPDGAIKNQHQVKTDAALPAYCTPPNPCPIGYTAEDGCLEQFENTAAFSREFQAAQDCMCDTEHMFKCPSNQHNHADGRNDISEADIDRFVHEFQDENAHKTLVAKKFHVKKSSNPLFARGATSDRSEERFQRSVRRKSKTSKRFEAETSVAQSPCLKNTFTEKKQKHFIFKLHHVLSFLKGSVKGIFL